MNDDNKETTPESDYDLFHARFKEFYLAKREGKPEPPMPSFVNRIPPTYKEGCLYRFENGVFVEFPLPQDLVTELPTLQNKELSDTENFVYPPSELITLKEGNGFKDFGLLNLSAYKDFVQEPAESAIGNAGVFYPEKPIGSIQHISEIKEMVIPAPKNENI